MFAVNSWALVISVLMLISQTAHLLVLLAKQPVEIVAIFRTNVRWHRTDYRVNHLLIKGRLPVHVVVLLLLLVFHMHFLISFFRPHCWYLLCRSRWTAAYVMRLCCWRFLVCLVTAWCLLALVRWTATTMTSGASATQQAMAWSGQSAVHFFFFFVLLVLTCFKSNFLCPSPASLSAGPWRQVCSAHCWSALHTRTIRTAARWLLSGHFMHSTWWEGHWSGEHKASANTFNYHSLTLQLKVGGICRGFSPIIEISSTYCTPWCQWRLWWCFLIHVPIRRGCPKLGTE